MNKKDKILKMLLIMVISGIFGFIYETIFYRIDLGYFVKRGDTLGPWLPIYSFGGLLITLMYVKDSNNSFEIFLRSMLVCGGLEYICGFIFLEYFGLRLWDYNNEILNFGNINGFICLRSILFFGISGVFLVKIVNPLLDKFKNKVNKYVYYSCCIIPAFLLLVDVLTHNLVNLIK